MTMSKSFKKWTRAFGNKNSSISIAFFVYKLKRCINICITPLPDFVLGRGFILTVPLTHFN